MRDPELWHGLNTYRLDQLDRDGRARISERYGAFLTGRLFYLDTSRWKLSSL